MTEKEKAKPIKTPSGKSADRSGAKRATLKLRRGGSSNVKTKEGPHEPAAET